MHRDGKCLQIPLELLLLETDAPDGKPRLDEPYQANLVHLQTQSKSSEQDLNHPANIRCVRCDLLYRMVHSCMSGQRHRLGQWQADAVADAAKQYSSSLCKGVW